MISSNFIVFFKSFLQNFDLVMDYFKFWNFQTCGGERWKTQYWSYLIKVVLYKPQVLSLDSVANVIKLFMAVIYDFSL
jgi:hypothetical protein